MSFHAVTRSQKHLAWDNSLQPVVRINSGETVVFDCIDASNGQAHASSVVGDLGRFVFEQLDPVNGPVYIEAAEPGDVLQVDVLELETADWGWTAALPGFGLLAEEFDASGLTPALKVWKLDRENGWAWFDEEKGIRIPLRPFCGEMGVARGIPGEHSTIPPYNTGGNIDTRHVVAGSTLYLPVEVKGALFSCGDGHAAQGDGEVAGTAIETPIKATLRFTVLKDKKHVKTPHIKTPPTPASAAGEEHYITTGVESNLLDATKAAVRYMIDTLVAEKGLTRIEAYFLCSVAGDLRLHEVVDMPNFVVGMMMPLSIFGHKAT
ncbi:acetamidase/formamidase [Peniophora sp. CONT]|nr:acetamidase/formamidase [Peniophora sp. CONT]